jgi:indole-3-glycerol phosphate synthase
MNTILEQIVETKRQEITERQAKVSIEDLKETITTLGRPRNFFHAITQSPKKAMNVIAEVKKASPSAGVIRTDFDPVQIAKTYAAAGADALSVLTDEKYFQGKLEYIHAVRDAVKLPVLRKDFIIDPYQVFEMIDLQILATELNLTCLIEVHDMDNLMRVRDHVIGFPHRSYSLLGINNRDLRTFKVDLANTLRLAELVEDRSVLVSESGIRSREDVIKLSSVGVRAALVGETLMRSNDVAGTMQALFAPIPPSDSSA